METILQACSNNVWFLEIFGFKDRIFNSYINIVAPSLLLMLLQMSSIKL